MSAGTTGHPLEALVMSRGFADGTLDPREVTDAALAAATKDELSAIASTDPDGARAAAAASAARWRAGKPLGSLDGVPITFKDSFHISGLPRWHGTAASPGPVSPADAAPVRRAREAGMVVVGKTTMPDYAMLMSGLSSQHGTVRNAWDPATNTAGSSSGAGPAVVTGACAIAVGTDMVGSVRLPAAVSGLASLKPTQGRIAYDPAGDYRSAGPMARSVDDVEAALSVLGRHDGADLYALPGRYDRGPDRLTSLHGRAVGVLRSLSYGTAVDDETAAAVEEQVGVLAGLGAEIVELTDLDVTPDDYEAVFWFMLDKGLPDHFGRSAVERGRVLPYIGEMLERSLSRTALDAARSSHRVAAATERVRRQLSGVHHVLSPVLPVRAWSAQAVSPDPLNPMAHMGFACWFNRLAVPAGTVPVRSAGPGACPVSVQVTGRRFADADVLDVLRLLEAERGFAIDYPEVAA